MNQLPVNQLSDVPLTQVPLKRLAVVSPITYASAIAHQLAAQHSASVPLLAQQIASAWTSRQSQPLFWQALPLPPAALLHLRLHATATGLIHIEVPDAAIALWLDTLLVPTAVVAGSAATAIAIPFALHHAHARCCSLLRLADRTGLIRLDQAAVHPGAWQLAEPNPVSWLRPDGQLRLSETADRTLIYHLFAALEARQRSLILESSISESASLKLLGAIADAFQRFHAARPLWRRATSMPTLQAQVALLLVTQRVLNWLLAEGLGIEAAIDL